MNTAIVNELTVKMRAFAKEQGRQPTRKEMTDLHGVEFEQWHLEEGRAGVGWNDLLVRAGFKPPRRNTISPEHETEMIQQLKDYYEENEILPGLRTFRAKDGYRWTKRVILNHFDTWNNYLEAAGFDRAHPGSELSTRDRNKVLDSLREAIESSGGRTSYPYLRSEGLIRDRDVYKRLFGGWTEALESIGLTPDTKSIGSPTVAKDGHICDSRSEARVDDWLHDHNIEHDIHIKYPRSKKRCDFRLPGVNIYIEYWGLYNDGPWKLIDTYRNRAKYKRLLAKKHGIRLLELYPEDNLDDKLSVLLDMGLGDIYEQS